MIPSSTSGALRGRVMLPLVLLLAGAGAPARAGTAELEPSVTLAVAGMSNPWLLPGPLESDAWLMVLPGAAFRWWTPRAGLTLEYGFSLQRYLDASLTGRIHEGSAGAWWRPAPTWRLEVHGGAADTAYDTPGPTVTEGTLPLLATHSTGWTAGGEASWTSGRLALWAGYSVLGRRSTGELGTIGTAPEAVDETFHEAAVSLLWDPAPRVRLSLTPLAQARVASLAELSYHGAGARLTAEVRPWAGATAGVHVRAQANRFDARTDVYARVGVELHQRLGRWVRVGLQHAYAANGSDDPLWDADRHVLLATAELGAPILKWGRP